MLRHPCQLTKADSNSRVSLLAYLGVVWPRYLLKHLKNSMNNTQGSSAAGITSSRRGSSRRVASSESPTTGPNAGFYGLGPFSLRRSGINCEAIGHAPSCLMVLSTACILGVRAPAMMSIQPHTRLSKPSRASGSRVCRLSLTKGCAPLIASCPTVTGASSFAEATITQAVDNEH